MEFGQTGVVSGIRLFEGAHAEGVDPMMHNYVEQFQFVLEPLRARSVVMD